MQKERVSQGWRGLTRSRTGTGSERERTGRKRGDERQSGKDTETKLRVAMCVHK